MITEKYEVLWLGHVLVYNQLCRIITLRYNLWTLFEQVKKYCAGKEEKSLNSLMMKGLNETQKKAHPAKMKELFIDLLEKEKLKQR